MRRALVWSWGLACGVVVMSLSNLALGWGGGMELFARAGRGLPAMVPVTALCFLALGVAQVVSVGRAPVPWFGLGLALAAPVAAWIYVGVASPGPTAFDRMSQTTVLLISLLGLSIAVGARDTRGARIGAATGSVAALLIGLGGLASFLFDVQEAERYRLLQGLSIPTSLAACLLALGVICGHPSLRAVGIVFATTPGGRVARWFLPYALLGPIVLTLAGDIGAELGLIGPKVRLAVLAVTLTALSASFVLSVSVYQDMVLERDRQAMAMMEGVLSGLDAGVVVLRDDDVPLLVNRALRELIGDQSVEEWLAADQFHDLANDRAMRGSDHPVRRALADRTGQIAALATAGEDMILQFAAFDVDGGRVARRYRVLVVSDVTLAWHQRDAMAMTERLNAVGHLAGGVAHEVTNIFGIIKLAAGTAELVAPEAAPEQYQAILTACRRGGDLADRLQRLSVTPDGEERVIDAAGAVAMACDLAARGLPWGIKLTRTLSEGPLPVCCDPMELEMAVLNLVLNARNALQDSGAEEGTIDVSLKPKGSEVHLVVRDTGPGLEPELLDRVTEPFFTTRADKGGTGFGLALIDAFAMRASGRLELASTPGEGLQVTVVLPLDEKEAEDREAARPEVRDLTGLRVLLAEDDPAFKDMLYTALTTLNAHVERADSAPAALTVLAQRGPFDVLVSAIRFAGPLSGADLAQQARAADPQLGVVFVTYDRGTSAESQGLPGPVLYKPVNLGALSQALVGEASRGQGRS